LCGAVVKEIQKAKRNPSSYFIDESVLQDGSLYITTPIDPLFLFLNRLDKARKKQGDNDDGMFVDIPEILNDPDCPNFQKYFSNKLSIYPLHLICDVKEMDESRFYRLNDNKVIQWLKRKVDNTIDFILSMKNPSYLVISSLKIIKDEQKLTNKQLITVSINIVAEYLSNKWLKLLQQEYGIAFKPRNNVSQSTPQKRKQEITNTPPSKKRKTSTKKNTQVGENQTKITQFMINKKILNVH